MHRKVKTALNKKVKNATPLIYNGIEFKSKLEAYFYKYSKEQGYDFKYEEFQTTLYEGEYLECFIYAPILGSKDSVKKNNLQLIKTKNQTMTYSPDFYDIIKNKAGKNIMVIIETKGLLTESYKIKKKLFLSHLNKKYGTEVYFFEPHNQIQIRQCFEILKEI